VVGRDGDCRRSDGWLFVVLYKFGSVLFDGEGEGKGWTALDEPKLSFLPPLDELLLFSLGSSFFCAVVFPDW
jgi:hypothetical protein